MSEKPAWKQAEEAAIDNFDLEPAAGNRGDDSETWYDAVDPFNRYKYQIKSAQANRRFRLWESDHRSLNASAGALGQAYYVFLADGRPMIRVGSTIVTQWIADRDGWNQANHASRPGDRQLKLPVQYVYEQADS